MFAPISSDLRYTILDVVDKNDWIGQQHFKFVTDIICIPNIDIFSFRYFYAIEKVNFTVTVNADIDNMPWFYPGKDG